MAQEKEHFTGSRANGSRERPDEWVLLRGTVQRITFHNPENGFAVLKLAGESSSDGAPVAGLVTVVGSIAGTLSTGANVIARGQWQTHPKFGRQFRAGAVTETEPAGEEAILRYLASGAIKGFGPVLAERIVKAFGADTLRVLDETPDRLKEVPGIGDKKLAEIAAAWQQKKNLREVLLFFQEHNISIGLAQRIYAAYGERAIEIVKRNPYVLARDIWGIGFHTADIIARNLGVDLRSAERVLAGLEYALKRASDDGHCYLPREVLIAKAGSLLEVDDTELIDGCIGTGLLTADFIAANDAIYLPPLAYAERELAQDLAFRLSHSGSPALGIPPDLVQSICEQRYHLPDPHAGPNAPPKVITLSEEQKEAIRLAAQRSLVVITGGPGCGKTTVLRTAARLFAQAGLRIKLAAPTGRAAQRLSEVCKMEASTIHRLLKFDPAKRSFLHDSETPLPIDALIVDESSMIDLPLAASLFKAVPANARIVVVGDADQLPSVGPGLFLADLLAVGAVPRVALTRLFRRADESAITYIAHQINSSVIPEIPTPDGQTRSDAYLLPSSDIAEAAALVERLVVEQVPKKFGFKPSDITVLSPMNQGDLGIIALNKRLQERLVPPRAGLPRVKIGNLEFRLGDRVCQRVNNYNIASGGVFNGDQGEVIGIDPDGEKVFVRLWDGREVEYGAADLHQLDLAYAITIHRSQGSEVPVVVLALHDSHNILLERQLVYTAVTRAKKLLIIVGTKRALILAIKKMRSKRRYSGLVERTHYALNALEDKL